MSQILEEEYENPTDEFIDLIECYKFDRSDYELEAYIQQLYSCAMSEPWPEQYLMKILEQLSFDSSEKFMESNVIKCMLIYVKSVIKDLGDFLEELLQITQEKDGPGWYFERLQKDLEICKKVEQASDYEQDVYKRQSQGLVWIPQAVFRTCIRRGYIVRLSGQILPRMREGT